ncbi:hypothetical protein [Nonomuraea sp. NPDC003201]
MGDHDERPSIERWAALFEHVAEFRRLYGASLSKRQPVVCGEDAVLLSNMVAQHLVPLPTSSGLVATPAGGMFVHVITWWLENGRPMAPYGIATQTRRPASALITEDDRLPGLHISPIRRRTLDFRQKRRSEIVGAR